MNRTQSTESWNRFFSRGYLYKTIGYKLVPFVESTTVHLFVPPKKGRSFHVEIPRCDGLKIANFLVESKGKKRSQNHRPLEWCLAAHSVVLTHRTHGEPMAASLVKWSILVVLSLLLSSFMPCSSMLTILRTLPSLRILSLGTQFPLLKNSRKPWTGVIKGLRNLKKIRVDTGATLRRCL